MFCKNCGGTIATSDEKCPRCGFQAPALSDCGGFYDLAPKAPKAAAPAVVPTPRESVDQSASGPAPAPSRVSPLLIAVLGGLLLVVLGLQVLILMKLADHENRINNLFGIVEKVPEDSTGPTEPDVTDPDVTDPSGTETPSDPSQGSVTDPTKVPEEITQATLGTTATPETEQTTAPTETTPSEQTNDPTQMTEPSEEPSAPTDGIWQITIEDVLISEQNQEKDESKVEIFSENCPVELGWASWFVNNKGLKTCTYISENAQTYITVQYQFRAEQESAAVTVLTGGDVFGVEKENASIALKYNPSGFASTGTIDGTLEFSNEEEMDFSLSGMDMERLYHGRDIRLEVSWEGAQGAVTIVLRGTFNDFFPGYEL